MVTTNGSSSERYYLQLANMVDSISFSTHSEFFNESEFFSKVISVNNIMMRPKKSVHVNIMDEFWNRDRIQIYADFLATNDISHSVNTIDYSQQIRSAPILQGKLNFDKI